MLVQINLNRQRESEEKGIERGLEGISALGFIVIDPTDSAEFLAAFEAKIRERETRCGHSLFFLQGPRERKSYAVNVTLARLAAKAFGISYGYIVDDDIFGITEYVPKSVSFANCTFRRAMLYMRAAMAKVTAQASPYHQLLSKRFDKSDGNQYALRDFWQENDYGNKKYKDGTDFAEMLQSIVDKVEAAKQKVSRIDYDDPVHLLHLIRNDVLRDGCGFPPDMIDKFLDKVRSLQPERVSDIALVRECDKRDSASFKNDSLLRVRDLRYQFNYWNFGAVWNIPLVPDAMILTDGAEKNLMCWSQAKRHPDMWYNQKTLKSHGLGGYCMLGLYMTIGPGDRRSDGEAVSQTTAGTWPVGNSAYLNRTALLATQVVSDDEDNFDDDGDEGGTVDDGSFDEDDGEEGDDDKNTSSSKRTLTATSLSSTNAASHDNSSSWKRLRRVTGEGTSSAAAAAFEESDAMEEDDSN